MGAHALTWKPEDVSAAIDEFPAQAADALAAIQFGLVAALTVDVLRVAAAKDGRTVTALWVDQLERMDKLDAFAEAMRAQGAPLRSPVQDLSAEVADRVDPKRLRAFTPSAMAFRCRIFKNGAFAGSGCLVGPSLALTAWHVVAVNPPGQAQDPAPDIKIRLSDGRFLDAAMPARFASICGDREFGGHAPLADADVAGRNDVALLGLQSPAAAHLGYARLPASAPVAERGTTLVLVDYPDGDDRGFGVGRTSKIRNVTARVRHDVTTAEGSSGGPCFDAELQFLGIHQGRLGEDRRLVPLGLFLGDLVPLVDADVAPRELWSLDETERGALVIGRDALLEAIAAAGAPVTRVGGVRIKRRDLAAGSTGLAFSHDILAQLLTRRGPQHMLVRVAFDAPVPDLAVDVRRRVAAAGLKVPAAADEPGVTEGQAAPEGAAKDRSAVLAGAINAAAALADRIVWFFFDNPSVGISEPARLFLEGFVAASLPQPRLRVVIAGYETIPLAGQEFASPSAAAGDGPPGFLVEYLGGFRQTDLTDFLARASRTLRGDSDPAANDTIAARVLLGHTAFNGEYPQADLPAVIEAMRPDLTLFRQDGGG